MASATDARSFDPTALSFSATKSYMDLVAECDDFPYDDLFKPNQTPLSNMFQFKLKPEGSTLGFMHAEVVDQMPWTRNFNVNRNTKLITIQPISPQESPTIALSELIGTAIDKNLFKILHGAHSENYPILGSGGLVSIERFAANLFGIISRGAHLTVYTHTSDEMKIWVPRRSPTLHTYPNCLDTTVAGGVASGEGPFECIVREADEEASLGENLVRPGVKACGCLSYISLNMTGDAGTKGLFAPDIIYVYDLEVAETITCRQNDDEVKEFSLMGVEDVKDRLAKGEFKTNSAVVMIDFFIRHGIITAENEKDYAEIIARMHRKLPFPMTP